MALGSINPTTDINTSPLAGAQLGMQYGPQTIQALRRSQYLADAIKQMQESGQKITGGWGELGARLLASAILQRSNEKGQDALTKAMKGDQDAETETALSGLRLPTSTSPIVAPQPQPDQPRDPGMSVPPQSGSGLPGAQASALPDANRLALARAAYGEARGEPALGQQAVASVILNRARASGKSLADVVAAPHQFAGYNPRTQALSQEQLAPILANIDPVLSGQIPDPTGGADHFYNPALAHPSWGQGQGQMIGQHKFMRLNDQGPGPQGPPQPDVQMTAGAPMQGPMQVAPSMAAAQGAQPYQIAANGQTPPPPTPSAPESSPPAGGGPPAAVPPQAMAAGGSPPMRQVNAWPMWKPSNQEVAYVESLLRNPRTHQAGVQLAQQLRFKATQPVEATVQIINGVPFYLGKDPTDQAILAMPVPKEAMSQHLDGPAAGLPPGAQMDVTPTGNRSVVYKPPEGYQSDGHGGLVPTTNGPADPRREQAPPSGYQYAPAQPSAPGQPAAPQQMSVIPGSPADPKTPMNMLQGTQSIQKELRPTIDLAVVARQSYGAVQTGFQQQNGAGDIAMVNGLQHLIDKGVVRGEDVNMQMKSNGLTGSIGSLSQYLQSGGLLTPEIRQRVLKTATDLFHNVDQTYRAQVMGYRQTVDNSYGKGAFDQYVMPGETVKALGWDAPADQPGAAQPPPVDASQFKPGSLDAAIAVAVKRGLPLSPQQKQRAHDLGLLR